LKRASVEDLPSHIPSEDFPEVTSRIPGLYLRNIHPNQIFSLSPLPHSEEPSDECGSDVCSLEFEEDTLRGFPRTSLPPLPPLSVSSPTLLLLLVPLLGDLLGGGLESEV